MSQCNCENNDKLSHHEVMAKMDTIIDRIGSSRRVIIPLLQAIQDEFNYLPADAIERIYERTEIERAQLISVSTFYSQFRHIPYGKHLIKVCAGTACHVKGANNVYDSFVRELKIKTDSVTTDDKLFSIEKVACLGCCTLAPVVQIDDKIYGHVAPGKVGELISEFIESNKAEEEKTGKANEYKLSGEVRLGMGSCCQASGSADIYNELLTKANELGIKVDIKSVGCVGVCNQVPLIDVVLEDGAVKRYPNVKASEIKEILHHHFKSGSLLRRFKNSIINHVDNYHTDTTWNNVVWKSEAERTGLINSFLSEQKHISTEGYGFLAPLDLDEYIHHQGFASLKKVIAENKPNQVVRDVLTSGLRGRGGGGFPTGEKMKIVASSTQKDKYLICNGDEGDPGAFMDRMILESYPYRVIEGMVIEAFATGANKGIFYIRAEYPLAVQRIKRALELCRERKLIGRNILGSNFSFEVTVFEGAGAFVCGEETALIASIEGDRGFPKQKPPFPAVEGLDGRPTLVNNVETLSQIPYIIRNGANHYAETGTENSKGTKVFALAGKIKNGGLIEVPMGISLNRIIDEIGGGVEGGEQLKAVQIGGPSGGCIPAHRCDVPVDFDSFRQMGAMMGSGGLVVLSESDCMVDVARYFLSFTCEESCGKCTFCRVGIRRMLDLLNRICSGSAKMEDIDKLEELALNVKKSSLCGLGKTAPNPVLTTLKYFRKEYEEHINGLCKTGKCKDMMQFIITDDCTGCTKCAKACPVDAIAYEPYKVHNIDQDACVKCGLCVDECEFNTIIKVPVKQEVYANND
ncbi:MULTISPECIES: NAD(P)H-dependent oxidoreductase subunit E [unclassified Carboxylicivirga]|uniref:NAD(P)H-dependent oxidoreductase subunit E n=1 Tax=Carboxylicivirga TaxID=1628153 RepID=UPI003D32E7B4